MGWTTEQSGQGYTGFLPWKRGVVLLLLCGLVFVLYPLVTRLYLGEWIFPFDDPWIHQVYARNLAQHGQYAFNPGELSSGSSAPLWTLLLAPAHLWGFSPVLWALLWGLIALGALAAVAWDWAERHFPPPMPLFLTLAILLSPQITWTGVEGMETALVAALALFILRRLDQPWETPRSPFLDGLLNGLLLWLRPEGPLLTLVSAWQRRREDWRRLLAFAGGFLVLAGPYVAFHLVVGGTPLPQTVYAKLAYYRQPLSLAGIAGFGGNLILTFAPGVLLLAAVLLPLALWWMARRQSWPWGPGLLWAGLTLLAAALRMPVVLHFGRHFAPILPPLLLAGAEALQELPERGRRAMLLLGGCLLLIGLVIGVSFYTPICRQTQNSQIAMGRWIDSHLPPGTTVATHDVGAIGYFGRHPVVDTLALVTPELTSVVATGDMDDLWAYLQRRDVRYLATLEDVVYAEIKHLPGVQQIVKKGRMELLLLPPRPTATPAPTPGASPSTGPGTGGTLPCLGRSATIEELVTCMYDYMPRSYDDDGRDGFDVPRKDELGQWRDVVGRMMTGECETIDLDGYAWGRHFTVTTFGDTENSTNYCVFMEDHYGVFTDTAGLTFTRVIHGWGTFIHNPTALLELNVSSPHVKFEPGTITETAGIFKHTQSRTFLINGAHRDASSVVSDCQSDYKRSDAAHDTEHTFHATVAALKAYYDRQPVSFYHLQFHGMTSYCHDDVFLSHGSGLFFRPGDRILALQEHLQADHPDWVINIVGQGTCDLYGSTNVQGRLLHDVPLDRLCDTAASGYSGYFLHIEQYPDYRHPDDWIAAIRDTAWLIYPIRLPSVNRNCLITGPGESCWQPPMPVPMRISGEAGVATAK